MARLITLRRDQFQPLFAIWHPARWSSANAWHDDSSFMNGSRVAATFELPSLEVLEDSAAMKLRLAGVQQELQRTVRESWGLETRLREHGPALEIPASRMAGVLSQPLDKGSIDDIPALVVVGAASSWVGYQSALYVHRRYTGEMDESYSDSVATVHDVLSERDADASLERRDSLSEALLHEARSHLRRGELERAAEFVQAGFHASKHRHAVDARGAIPSPWFMQQMHDFAEVRRHLQVLERKRTHVLRRAWLVAEEGYSEWHAQFMLDLSAAGEFDYIGAAFSLSDYEESRLRAQQRRASMSHSNPYRRGFELFSEIAAKHGFALATLAKTIAKSPLQGVSNVVTLSTLQHLTMEASWRPLKILERLANAPPQRTIARALTSLLPALYSDFPGVLGVGQASLHTNTSSQ